MEKEQLSNSVRPDEEETEEFENNELVNEENVSVEEEDQEYDDDDDDDDDDDEYEGEDEDKIAIDLSDNPVYRGLCTLLEDDEGNNLLEYISLLHSELIGHNKTMKGIKKDLGRIANAAEMFVKKMDR